MKKTYLSCIVTSLALSGCLTGESKEKQMTKPQETHKTKEAPVALQKTNSGLGYEVIKEASSKEKPQPGQTVTVHYTGWLDEKGEPGKKFDSSVDRNQKFSFTVGVGQVIKGWDEALLGMHLGEKRRVFIPANLGYGAHGAGGAIPPHANLIFDIELFEIKS